MDSIPAPYPEVPVIAMVRGDTWDFPEFDHQDQVTAAPLDFTGQHVRVIVRQRFGDADPPVMTLDTASGGAVMVDAPTGKWRLDVSSALTAALIFSGPSQLYYYTAILYTPGSTPEYDRTILRGSIRVNSK